jgi:hypothetical protein
VSNNHKVENIQIEININKDIQIDISKFGMYRKVKGVAGSFVQT